MGCVHSRGLARCPTRTNCLSRGSKALGSLTACGVPPRHASSRSMAHECKNPTERNPVGFLVLAMSYSRTAYRRTTIGAAAFHFRVRNGNGWCHRAIITRILDRNLGAEFWRIEDLKLPIANCSSATSTIKFSKNIDYKSSNLKSAIFNCRFSDIYIQEEECDSRFVGHYIGFSDSRFNDSRNLKSFVLFEIFHLFCLPFRRTRNGLTEK